MSIYDLPERIREQIDLDGDCWFWLGKKDKFGYGRVSWNGNSQTVHRVVYEILKGLPPAPMMLGRLRAICESKMCCNPDHWQPTTKKRLGAYLVKQGLVKRGQIRAAFLLSANRRKPHVKLDMQKAEYIRQSQERSADLAEKFGVSISLVQLVRQGKLWKQPSPFSI